MIPLSVPSLKGNEIIYATDAIKTQWVSTSGQYVTKFEKSLMDYLKVEDAVATQSGTASIHLALRLCDVLLGDEVIVPTLTFIATVNPIKYLGAEPIFMDCDDSLNMDVNKLESFLKEECELSEKGLRNKATSKIIKAIMVVHVFGNMAKISEIKELADKYNLKLIEDATEALGTYYTEGKYKGKYAGTVGDFGAFSFNGNKILTTGGGGLLVGRSKELISKARYLSTQAKDDEVYYIHNEIGYNYRMTNLQAAIGLAQMESIEKFISCKINNYKIYKEHIDKIPGLRLLEFNKTARNNYWFYSLILEGYSIERDELLKHMQRSGVQTRPIWGLIHTQRPYKNNQTFKIEKANYYLGRTLNIPCSTNLTNEDILYIVSKL
ncbi:LegC family aminotransferase [Clostridium gasigenes]|uniref:LegC family aminotransferase n=1 Tax=Clostridium gasigenes TaxID=94869 RepID=UPI0014385940|nr:LegC family aminotransferase [Clostridium gasigenes]NKF05585.1 LegC family aminotransferase [Clostridium gasigenes]QSW19027.1 LegC family aminotransferase [Clostridium gasigenes]